MKVLSRIARECLRCDPRDQRTVKPDCRPRLGLRLIALTFVFLVISQMWISKICE